MVKVGGLTVQFTAPLTQFLFVVRQTLVNMYFKAENQPSGPLDTPANASLYLYPSHLRAHRAIGFLISVPLLWLSFCPWDKQVHVVTHHRRWLWIQLLVSGPVASPDKTTLGSPHQLLGCAQGAVGISRGVSPVSLLPFFFSSFAYF